MLNRAKLYKSSQIIWSLKLQENLNDDELRGPTKALCKINKDYFEW